METIARVAAALQTVLGATASAAARASGSVKRRGKLSGAQWVQSLVFGWLANPDASLSELSHTAASLGVSISPQALDQRFTPEASACLEAVLGASLQEVVRADPVAVAVLERFAGVYLQDSTTIALPAVLQERWRGCGGSGGGGAAALKAQVWLDLKQGTLQGPLLADGRAADQRLALDPTSLPHGSLLISDLGYFAVDTLAQATTTGRFWLTRLKVNTALWDCADRRWELGVLLGAQQQATLDQPMRLGVRQQTPGRLIGVRLPAAIAAGRRRTLHAAARQKGKTASAARLAVADWTVLMTNSPLDLLSLAEAMVLYRARWQIERLFKLWKTHGKVALSRSAKPWRILCEVYAKLLGVVVQHWVSLTGAWRHPNRSLWKAAHTVCQHALRLATAFADSAALVAALTTLAFCLSTGCRLDTRRTHPSTAQLLTNPALRGLA